MSTEDNCSLPQQRRMATAFQDVFGDMLLTQPVDKNETALPSPHDLRRKIILKHKKLPDGELSRVELLRPYAVVSVSVSIYAVYYVILPSVNIQQIISKIGVLYANLVLS